MNLSQSRSAVAQIQFAVTPAELTQVKIKFRIRIKIRDRGADKWSKKIKENLLFYLQNLIFHTHKRNDSVPSKKNAYLCIVSSCKCLVVLHLHCLWYISAEVHHIKVLRLWSNLTWRPCRCTLLSPIVSFSWPFRQLPQNPLDYDNRTSQGIFRTMRINWQELASKSVKSPIHMFVVNRFIGIAPLWNSCRLNGHNDTSPWFIKMDAWLMSDNHGTAFFRIVDQVALVL